MMKNDFHPLPLVVGLVLLFPLLSGCIGPADSDPEPGAPRFQSPLGLGWSLPASLPEPGPFLEDPEDLQVLESFLLDEGAKILEECGGGEAMQGVQDLIDERRYGYAVWDLISGCGFTREELEQVTKSAMVEGRELDVRDEWHNKTLAALAFVDEKLGQVPGPGNVVEVELLQSIMRPHRWYREIIETAFLHWDAYLNSTPESAELELLHVYGNLAWAGALTMIEVIDRYPWSSTPCTPPDMEAIFTRIHANLDEAKQLAEERGDPEQAKYPLSWLGRLGRLEQDNAYYDERGWWPALLSTEVLAEIQVAYWQNLTAPAWPSFEEAEYWLALQRNQSRTIWTETYLEDYIYHFTSPWARNDLRESWHDDIELGAAGFMGWMAMRWPYADLECPQ